MKISARIFGGTMLAAVTISATISAIGALFVPACAHAAHIATSAQISPHVSFAPPPFLTPQNVLSARPANQFDGAGAFRSAQYSVADTLNSAFNPAHFTAGLYGATAYGAVLGKFRASNIYGALAAHYTRARDYKDGTGRKIGEQNAQGYGYTRTGGALVLGFVPNAANELRATLLFDEFKDEKQPHYAMDASRTTRYAARLDYRLGQADGSNTLALAARYRDITRRANNYEMRGGGYPRTKMQVGRKIFDLTASYSVGAADGALGVRNEFGASISRDEQRARRLMANPPAIAEWTHNAWRIPHVVADEFAAFDTLSWQVAAGHKFEFGAEIRHSAADIRERDSVVGQSGATTITPNNMYVAHYGRRVDGDIAQDAVSVAARYEFAPSRRQSFALDLQSIERIGTNEERFVAVNPAGNTLAAHRQAWVSNPFLRSERHSRAKFEFGAASEFFGAYMKPRFDENGVRVSGALLADFVTDLIIYDRNRAGANAMYQAHIITRNVDARIFSARVSVEANLWRGLGVRASGWWSYGQNESDGEPLYQIRPLEAQITLDYESVAHFGRWSVGAGYRAASAQHRRNGVLGIDAQKGGFGVADIYAAVSWRDKIAVKIGVDNVFDKTYSEFISASHVEAIAPTSQINAPGRTFYVNIVGNF